ncbi:Guanine nucleotide exchange factor for Cdc42p [Cryptotrichosporon argae]
MSISRKRVGSVSQRNDSPLPQLDIQSIQMPMNPQNALALKTAALSSTKSLFQMATGLRKRLRNVEDFGPFLEQGQGEPLDVVSHMCHVFRLGSPLCHLYNLLIPAFVTPSSNLYAPGPTPNQIEYDFPTFVDAPTGVRNWAKRDGNAKVCQKYIAMFCMAMKQRREEGRWHGEIWALHELWGKSTGDDVEAYDSSGLTKVLQTVESMLDNLPESAMSPTSPATPFTAASHFGSIGPMSSMRGPGRQSCDLPFSAGGTSSGSNAVAHMAATMNGGVHVDHEASSSVGPSMQRAFSSQASAGANAFKSVEELVNSEKSYVQELEILERCSAEILQAELVSAETVFSMFSNLSKILDFQRKFLIKLETEYEPIEECRGPHAWAEGRWGLPFVEMEKDFEVYGPYCANYLDAIRVVNEYMVNLMAGQSLPESDRPCLHPERELQAFMIKPIQRITKYGLLLDAILHATAKHDYPHRAELEAGLAAVRRIAADINETTAFKAKQATVRELVERVDDWKGHNHEMFGDLHLDDQFTVSKNDSPREYHVFLFEKMMLCCKDIAPEKKSKSSKNSSMLRKDRGSTSKNGAVPAKPRLALKGRIFVSNITSAVLMPPLPSDTTGTGPARVQVTWTVPSKNGDFDTDDYFLMSGKSEEQMRKWADKTMELATAEKKRQQEERAARAANGHARYSSEANGKYWAQSTFAPPTPAAEHPGFAFPPVPTPSTAGMSQFGTEDGYDDDGLRSGRTTPSLNGSTATYVSSTAGVGGGPSRRVQSQQGLPPLHQAELRARAMTEDQFGPSMTQWRTQHPSVPAMPPPPLSRLASDASFAPRMARQGSGAGLPRYGDDEYAAVTPTSSGSGRYPPSAAARQMTRAPSHGVPSIPHPPPLRSRSASSPNVYQHPQVGMATMPATGHGHGHGGIGVSVGNGSWIGEVISEHPGADEGAEEALRGGVAGMGIGGTALFARRESSGTGTSTAVGSSGEKRSSSGSQSTQTSESSSQSPATPYTHAAAEIRGMPIPVSRKNSGDSVLVRVKAGEATFTLGLPLDASFRALHERVARKLRLAGGKAYDPAAAVKIKWLDSDGDAVVIQDDGDVQMMFAEADGEIQLIAA